MAHKCVTCRATVVRYAATVCAQCRNVGKRDLNGLPVQVIAPGEVVDPRAIIDQQLAALNLLQVRLQAVITDETEFRADLAKEARELARALMDILREWRQHEKESADHVRTLSDEDKHQIFRSWARTLDDDSRLQLIAELSSDLDKDRAEGVA